MASYFLDSSAIIKLYHVEEGTAAVESIMREVDAPRFIARLTLITSLLRMGTCVK
jgi:hypothetical protein